MKFMSKDMKDVLTIIKRMCKDKKVGKMVLQARGDMRIYIKGISDEGNAFTYHAIPSLDDEEFSIVVNPYDLDTHVKGKNEEREFKLTKTTMTLVGSKASYKIKQSEEDIQFYLSEMKDVVNSAHLIQILKGSETALKKNKEVATSYLKLTSEKGMTASETQLHLFRVGEMLPFEEAFIHKDNVSLLAKSLKGEIKIAVDGDFFVLLNQDHYFLVKLEKNPQFPTLRNISPIKRDFSFTVDATEMNVLLKNYTTKVSEIMLEQDGDSLSMNPRNPDFPTQNIPVIFHEGKLRKAIFALDVFKSFFFGYEGEVKIEQQQFKNVYGTVGYLWRVYTPDKLTMMTGIEEPDWEKIETFFREGRIKELSPVKK